jgi:hypothetical protein
VGKGRSYKISLSWEIGVGYIKNNWELSHLETRLRLKSADIIPSDFHVLQVKKVLQQFGLHNIEWNKKL